ncbi:MAG TPA: NADH-quinone oxidoreductase subunit C [Candidatus Enterocloster faecavium]|uniref:NADH-quinone oxidoreductase subunit C n=1 Tax=Candidatus Enterocloster faecavium TaxID=2838560 RepID=A0A9D2RK65_9FIRM|nr:NADH-quinone oxidoreductase subunit C [Candidatus Enterocloster faecavium]
MDALNEILPIAKEEFLPAVIRFKMEGRRLVQICAVRLPEGYELSYSFSKGYDMQTLRLQIATNEKISSITQIYPCAFMQENETAELFGVQIENMDRDYNGRLYRIDRETPFKEKG